MTASVLARAGKKTKAAAKKGSGNQWQVLVRVSSQPLCLLSSSVPCVSSRPLSPVSPLVLVRVSSVSAVSSFPSFSFSANSHSHMTGPCTDSHSCSPTTVTATANNSRGRTFDGHDRNLFEGWRMMVACWMIATGSL